MSIYLIAALGLSLALNAFLGNMALGQHDNATVAKTETKAVTAVAQECSKGTEAMSTKAVANAKAAAPKREAAKKTAEAHNKVADQILAAPPAVPGDSCKSAEALVDDWWKGRAK